MNYAGLSESVYYTVRILSIQNFFPHLLMYNFSGDLRQKLQVPVARLQRNNDQENHFRVDAILCRPLDTAAAAEGTVEAIEAAKTALLNGEIKVFDTSADNFMLKDGAKIESYTADVDTDEAFTPDTEVVLDGYFHESEFRSAPYFDVQLDGIELLNSKF